MAEARNLRTEWSAVLAPLLLLSFAGCRGEVSDPRLLLLLSVDTLRADKLGAYGSDLGLTPHLDAVARESQVFESAYAPTSFTLPSLSSLLTGRYPEEIGVLGNRSALAPAIPTLAGELRARGWRTAAVVSNLVLRENSGLAAGFDRYDDALPDRELVRNWPERIAAGTTDAALRALEALLEAGDERLFLWVHYQDPHGPYTPPAGLRERFLAAERQRPDGRRRLPEGPAQRGQASIPRYQIIGEEREVAFYRAGYDAEIHYVDAEVGRLLRALNEAELWDETLLVFTADHGESLGEGDYWFAHGARLSEALVRVPLLIRVPDLAPRRRLDVASLVDLFPTLLRRLESAPLDANAPGRDLLAAEAPEIDSIPYLATLGGATSSRFGIVEGGYRFILSKRGERWRGELFRLGDDDREVSHSEPERAERLRSRLAALRAGLQRGRPEQRKRLTLEERENLRALGYLDEHESAETD